MDLKEYGCVYFENRCFCEPLQRYPDPTSETGLEFCIFLSLSNRAVVVLKTLVVYGIVKVKEYGWVYFENRCFCEPLQRYSDPTSETGLFVAFSFFDSVFVDSVLPLLILPFYP